MKNRFYLLCIPLILVFTTSCSQRVMDFTLVSSKNVELSKFPTFERGDVRTEGKDTKPIIFIIPTGMPSGKEAIDKAIENIPGAVALVDGVLDYKWFYIPYIYGEYVYVVEGTPLIDPTLVSIDQISELEDHSICLLDRKGDIIKSLKVEKEEYYSIREEIFKSPRQAYKMIINR